jgi:hypothetical protein
MSCLAFSSGWRAAVSGTQRFGFPAQFVEQGRRGGFSIPKIPSRRRRACVPGRQYAAIANPPLATRAAPPSRALPMSPSKSGMCRAASAISPIDQVSLAIEAGEFFTLLGRRVAARPRWDDADSTSPTLARSSQRHRSRRQSARSRPVRTVFQATRSFRT